MKVIFLDIDGVLNNEKHAHEMLEKVKSGEISEDLCDSRWDLPYEGTLLPLQKIIQETGAIIVLSSTWRLSRKRINQLNEIFKEYNFQISDTTEDGVWIDWLVEMGFDPSKCYHKYANKYDEEYTTDRGAEIMLWLRNHSNVESFVILDDDIADIKPYYTEEHVQTDFYGEALNMECAEKAIKILNKGDYENEIMAL